MTEAQRLERRKWLALGLLAAAQFVVVLDASIVNVALPSIGRDLQIESSDLSWVVNAYTLFFGGFLLLGGRMADLLGRRRVFMGGLILFALASLAGGLAQDELQLIIARAVQGLGAAILSPAALSIVTTTFSEGAERNKALGVWGAVAGSGGAAGVLLGGVLTDALSWEWVLFVNVPIGLAAAALAPVLLADTRDTDRHRSFDAAGAVAITAGLSILVYALVDAEDAGWGSTQTVGLLSAAVLLIAAFVFVESRTPSPLVPFRVFRLRTLTASNVIGLLIGMSLFSMFFFVSLYMQNVLEFDALKTGLAYLPLALTIIFTAGLASQLVTRLGFKPVLMLGLALVGIGLVWFAQVSVGGSYVGDVLFPSIIAGAGLGFSFVPVTIAAVAGTKEDESGLASGLINTSQQIGGALGLAILSTIAFADVPDGRPDPAALTGGFQDAFLVGAGFAFLGLIIAAVAVRGADSAAVKGADALPAAA
ncbi:MAG TPA: MFS transporter [Solirubrobacteraceae bacterium]|jgi:EmrB/QacA subfamily drug resistance transporter